MPIPRVRLNAAPVVQAPQSNWLWRGFVGCLTAISTAVSNVMSAFTTSAVPSAPVSAAAPAAFSGVVVPIRLTDAERDFPVVPVSAALGGEPALVSSTEAIAQILASTPASTPVPVSDAQSVLTDEDRDSVDEAAAYEDELFRCWYKNTGDELENVAPSSASSKQIANDLDDLCDHVAIDAMFKNLEEMGFLSVPSNAATPWYDLLFGSSSSAEPVTGPASGRH
jgi:hypothetical protein